MSKTTQHGFKNDEEAIDAWLGRKSALTFKSYNETLTSFRQFTGHKPLDEVTFADMEGWTATIQGQSKATFGRKIYTVSSLYKYLMRARYLSHNPAALIEPDAPDNNLAARMLTREEIEKIFAATEAHKEHRLLSHLLYFTGARISEIVGLKWKAFKEVEGGAEVTLLGKRDKTRTVRIPDLLWLDLCEHRGKRALRSAVFLHKGEPATRQQLYDLIKDAGRMAGIPSLSPHWFRHAIASHSLANGMPLLQVSRTLGHTSVKATERYLHTPDDADFSKFVPMS